MLYRFGMSKPLQIKNPSDDLYSRMVESAERNFRSITQEMEARLVFSFEAEDALVAKVHQKWLDEAAAGKFSPGSIQRLKEVAAKARAATT